MTPPWVSVPIRDSDKGCLDTWTPGHIMHGSQTRRRVVDREDHLIKPVVKLVAKTSLPDHQYATQKAHSKDKDNSRISEYPPTLLP
jgi:hypothetical protein